MMCADFSKGAIQANDVCAVAECAAKRIGHILISDIPHQFDSNPFSNSNSHFLKDFQ